ncbi:Putative zinc-finger [Clostridium cavendishii DSM 21758]|uniref:Putative zinc-finger n=1 Tax=Clostridium cavendishii DSM 21758 TaxID=1121302 RepID=A0A1M6JDF6_9CLOT|nr:zf-HC2 domain-containing protein [Clostridium cavendishii]SHJ44622.1 Putative zinc-finger [Clostridium cavendishii DSM 21758]
MKCSNCIKLISNVLEGDITTQELNEFKKHIEECDECRVEYNFSKEAREGLKKNIDIEGFVFTDCKDELMSKIDKNKYKDKKKNKLRKNYSFLKKLSPIIAACIIGIIIITNYSAISKFFIENKVSDKNKEITDTMNLENINPNTAKLKSIKDSDKFIVKEIPNDYGYRGIYDKDNLIVTKSFFEESSESFLFNVNTGKLQNFISVAKPENYIIDIKYDGNFVLWLEFTKSSMLKSVGKNLWFVFAKNIKTNEVFMMQKGELRLGTTRVPEITLNNGIGTVKSLDKQGNCDKFLFLDLNNKTLKEIGTDDSEKDPIFNFLGVTRVQDKILWCKRNDKNNEVYDIYYYDLKSNEKKQLPYSSSDKDLCGYGEYILVNNNGKVNLLNINTSKMVNLVNINTSKIVKITEENMNMFKDESGFYYSKFFSNFCLTKDYIYFKCDQFENINAFIYDINENIYYKILDKVDYQKEHIGRIYCKDRSMILYCIDSTKITKALYIVAK